MNVIGHFAHRSLRVALLASALIVPLVTARAAVDSQGDSPKGLDSQPGNYLAALIASSQSDTAAAEAYFRRALAADPQNRDLLERAFIAALSNGDIDKASALGDQLLSHDATNRMARLATAVPLIARGQYASARSRLIASDPRPRDVTNIFLAAWTYAGQTDQRHALGLLDQIRDPGLSAFRDYHAGLIANFLGDQKEAKRRLKSAYEANRNTLRFADAYGRFLSAHGDPSGARDVYAALAAVLPDNPLVEAALADLAAGRSSPSIIRSAKDGAAEVLYGLGGEGMRQTGGELPSLIYLRLSQYLRPSDDLAAIMLANLLDRLKQGDQAIAAYRSVPETSPLRGDAEIQVALVLDGLGKGDEARQMLARIVAERPGDIDALSALAGLQRMDKKYAEAAESYSKAIAAVGIPRSENWPLFYFRGICYERDKKWPKAEADFKKALELHPDQPQVLNYLGYSWVDQGVNLDQAFKMLRRAVDLRPNDGYIVDSLGWAHFKLGQYDQAAQTLEKAVNLKPSDPVLNDHLGDAYWKVNRRVEARFQWNHARDMGPEADDLPEILKKIQDGMSEGGDPEAREPPQVKSGG